MTDATTHGRTIHMAVQIASSPEAVWRALTDAAELARWFPLDAAVTPGPGGTVQWSWGKSVVWESEIVGWEPGRRLALAERSVVGDQVHPGDPAKAAGRVMEFTLESRAGSTVLRLVHSGFSTDADWERELHDGVQRGWTFELRALRHYLEEHPGEPRRVAWVHRPFTQPLSEAWQTLFSRRAFLAAGSIDGLSEGSHYRIAAATGDVFEGRVLVNIPGVQFSATVANMNNGVLRVELEHVGEKREITVWLSTYGVEEAKVHAFRARWDKLLGDILQPGVQ